MIRQLTLPQAFLCQMRLLKRDDSAGEGATVGSAAPARYWEVLGRAGEEFAGWGLAGWPGWRAGAGWPVACR